MKVHNIIRMIYDVFLPENLGVSEYNILKSQMIATGQISCQLFVQSLSGSPVSTCIRLQTVENKQLTDS
jgi:hypothetical protein